MYIILYRATIKGDSIEALNFEKDEIELIDEINNGSWVVVKNKTNYLFKKDIKNMWGENMKEMDEKFKIWSNAPENPQDN